MLCWCLISTFARAEHINPDTYFGIFEHPLPPPGSFVVIDSGERYGAWRVVGAAGNVTFVSGAYQHRGFNFLAQGTGDKQTKNAWANLAGLSQSATGLSHFPLPTQVGKSYTVTFYIGNIYAPGDIYGTTSSVAVYENSKYLGTFTNSLGQGTQNETWQKFSLKFNADAPYTTMAFINADPPGDLNCGIDNITFQLTAIKD
jgi:hypothetical protein